MRGSKTLSAILAAAREAIARGMQPHLVHHCKPARDTRDTDMRSQSGITRSCMTLPKSFPLVCRHFVDLFETSGGVLVVDEVQFLPLDQDPAQIETHTGTLIELFLTGALHGWAVFLAGLDADFLGHPFPLSRALLMNPAIQHEQRMAVCAICGSEHATLTQRLFGLQPASRAMPSILPEGENARVSYEPRCLHCHRIPD